MLGIDPDDPAWGARTDDRLLGVVDTLVAGLLDERTQARAAKDWARADEIRDRLKAAGVEITDTPDGPTWSI